RQAAAELEIEQSYTSLEAMLACKDLEAVVIATPDKFHAQAVRVAAAAGKDILCEKPLATNLSDAHAALNAVAKAGVRLQIGFMRRYDPAYEAAMKRVEAGEIGEPVVFKSVGRDKDVPPIAAYQSKVNGMLLYNNTIHDFDLARWLMRDEVVETHAYTTVAMRPEVVGSKGSVFIGSLEKTPAVFLSANGGAQILADHFLSRFADAYLAEARDFVHNMLHDRPPRVSGEDGLKALGIAVAAENSHLQGKPCKVTTELSSEVLSPAS